MFLLPLLKLKKRSQKPPLQRTEIRRYWDTEHLHVSAEGPSARTSQGTKVTSSGQRPCGALQTNTWNSAWTKKCPLQEQEIICISHQAGKVTLGVLRTHATLDAATRVSRLHSSRPVPLAASKSFLSLQKLMNSTRLVQNVRVLRPFCFVYWSLRERNSGPWKRFSLKRRLLKEQHWWLLKHKLFTKRRCHSAHAASFSLLIHKDLGLIQALDVLID